LIAFFAVIAKLRQKCGQNRQFLANSQISWMLLIASWQPFLEIFCEVAIVVGCWGCVLG